MHTFFVNTSERIDPARHTPLFDNLVSQNQLRIISRTLDRLDECADYISDAITRGEDMSEQYNIIVYAEIAGRNESAIAVEKAVSLQIEENLFSQLYARGRRPNQALILFGENFTRDAEYSNGKEYKKNVQSELWKLFPLPEEKRAGEILREARSRQGDMADSELPAYLRGVWQALVNEKSEQAMLSENSNFVISTICEMVESLGDKNPSEGDLQNELYRSVLNQRTYVQKQVTVEKVKYAHVRLYDSDFQAANRTEYQILLYVYACACFGRIEVSESSDNRDDYENSAALAAATIPPVRWEELATVLKKKKWIFGQELTQIELSDEKFPMFREDLINDPKIIPVQAEPPELFVQMTAHGGLTVSGLRHSVNSTLAGIEEKTKENQTKIKNYITRITDVFSNEKDSKMGNIEVMRDEEYIESDTLTADYIRAQRDAADAKVVEQEHLYLSQSGVDELLKDARLHTNYYFDCLKRGWLIYLIGLLFTVLFLIPYAALQFGLFSMVHGWAFFIFSMVLTPALFTACYGLFRVVYKNRILREMRRLCDRFTSAQKENQACIDQYSKLISHSIPLSFCLRTYENRFNAYLERKNTVPYFITSHKKILHQYIKYIDNLLHELEISRLGKEPEVAEKYSSILVLDLDQYRNNTLYSIVDEQSVALCLQAENDGGER